MRMRKGGGLDSRAEYAALDQWSVQSPEAFWQALAQFCELKALSCEQRERDDGDKFPGARWFPEARPAIVGRQSLRSAPLYIALAR